MLHIIKRLLEKTSEATSIRVVTVIMLGARIMGTFSLEHFAYAMFYKHYTFALKKKKSNFYCKSYMLSKIY